ncbi:related to HypA-like protein [Fusarium torulosum]|uniref:Related to HypA-like protein n=1 Tax=Fusarium torulosum TaxID=33205 RepID=A0AAE8M381_9HYPO|nr:related to HypA-like protein [Fusarium torulosum]
MATPFKIKVEPQNSGLLGLKLGENEASKVTDLLQKDLEDHHVFFNEAGFHDHLVHQVLTLYGTGATPNTLDKAYDANKSYQLKAMKPKSEIIDKLEHGSDWSEYLGKGRNYATFFRFFQDEIERIGWQETLKEYLFKDDARGRDMQSRLFAGVLHPLIQLLYGMEWSQPMIIAAGLAQAAVHRDDYHEFFTLAAKKAKASDAPPKMKTIIDLYEEVAKDEKLKQSSHWEDSNRVFDGVLVRAKEEMIDLAARVRIGEDELDERTAEMVHTSAFVATGAAFHPPYSPRFDFILMHHINSTPFFITFNNQSWIPASVKARFLEYKIRMDLLQYIARGTPALRSDLLREYKPQDGDKLVDRPEDLFPRIHEIVDDGHTVKLARALMLAQRVTKPYQDKDWVRIKGDDEWLKAVYVLLDVNGEADKQGGTMWVRSAGFEEAWEDIPKAKM